MFERMTARVQRAAEKRALLQLTRLAARLGDELPTGVSAAAKGDGVVIEGKDLSRRFALEPGLRWLLAKLR